MKRIVEQNLAEIIVISVIILTFVNNGWVVDINTNNHDDLWCVNERWVIHKLN